MLGNWPKLALLPGRPYKMARRKSCAIAEGVGDERKGQKVQTREDGKLTFAASWPMGRVPQTPEVSGLIEIRLAAMGRG